MADERTETAAGHTVEEVEEEATLPEPLRPVIEQADRDGATDIHIDPVEDGFALRQRIDGVIHDRGRMTAEQGRRLVNEVKVASRLEIEMAHEPLEGHFRYPSPKGHRSVRVSIIPSLRTEAAHLRLLQSPQDWRDITRLGMSEEDHERVQRCVKGGGGLILIAGPTGSGKTTTLYALAAEADLKTIIGASIEDPVEYDLPYLRQLEVDEQRGLGMYDGLRILLRMDPDVLVIGEVRDKPSAVTAARAALAGRLVIATVHARDTAGAIESMHYDGVPYHVLGEALRLVVAQDLVRRVDRASARPRTLEPHERELFEKAGLTPPDTVAETGATGPAGDGYLGRTGVFEVAAVDQAIGSWLARGGRSRQQIRQRFAEVGTRPLLHDALRKAADGVTTVREVLRLWDEHARPEASD